MTTRSTVLHCALAAAIAAAAAVESQDWPQWRGPRRDGAAASFTAPATWPETLDRRWQLEVGEGHAGPVLAQGTVFVFSREGGDEVVRAVSLADGEVRWRQSYAAPYKMHSAATAHGKGPKSTPAVDGGRLYTLGLAGAVSAFDAETGKLLWQRTFADRFETTSPLYGAAASPLVDGRRVIVHVGGHHDGALTAFDTATGETVWDLRGDGPGYASPILVDLGGGRQVVTLTDRHVVGVDAGDGTLRWKIPWTTAWDQNCVTPVVAGGRLILAGFELPTRAYELHATETPAETWAQPGVPMYTSSPVVAGNRVFGLSHLRSGLLYALDAGSGELIWSAEGRGGDHATVVRAGDFLFVLNDRAELIVLDPRAEEYSPLARWQVAKSATWAHPVVTERGILVKDKTALAFLGFGKAEAEAPPPEVGGGAPPG